MSGRGEVVRRRGVVVAVVVLLAVAAPLPAVAAGPEPGPRSCPAFGPPEQVGSVPDTTWWDEVSGVVASRTSPGVLWAIADSGNAADVVAADLEGNELARLDLGTDLGAANVDWEDLAIGPGPGGVDHLYVGDIGDNGPSNLDDDDSIRGSISVYRLPEPEVAVGDELGTVEVPADEVLQIEASYPDVDSSGQPDRQDAEALLLDPVTGDLLVVTKRIGFPSTPEQPGDPVARVYELAAPHGTGPTEMALVGTVGGSSARWLTGGDVGADGSQILLRSYGGAFLWHRTPGESVAEALAGEPCPLEVGDPAVSGNQGEAVAFVGGTAGYVTVSERADPEAPAQAIWHVDAACELPGITPNTFPDVPTTFDDGVSWFACFAITTGYPDGTFRTTATANRAQLAAFLHRFFDRPAAPGPPTFPDVSATHLFAGEIAWLASTGITTGYVDGTFRPMATVTRAQAAAFLHRAAGSPAVPSEVPSFPDVGVDHPFRDEIRWMAQHGLATGYFDGTYRPSAPVSRGALALFLFRLAGTEAAWSAGSTFPSPVLF
jgi:hypothetical protein